MCFQKLELKSSIWLVTFDYNYTLLTCLTQIDTQIKYFFILLGTLFSLLFHILENPCSSSGQIPITHSLNITHILQQITLIVQPLECLIPADILQPNNTIRDPAGLKDSNHTHLTRVVTMRATACLSVHPLDLYYANVRGWDSTTLVEVHALF